MIAYHALLLALLYTGVGLAVAFVLAGALLGVLLALIEVLPILYWVGGGWLAGDEPVDTIEPRHAITSPTASPGTARGRTATSAGPCGRRSPPRTAP